MENLTLNSSDDQMDITQYKVRQLFFFFIYIYCEFIFIFVE